MTIMRVERSTTIEVDDYRSLLNAWKLHGGPLTLVGYFRVRKPLTDSQFRRLPKALQTMLERPSDAVEWLRDLWDLPDTRD